MMGPLTLVGIVGTDGASYFISFPDGGGRLSIPVDQCRITHYGVTVQSGARVKILAPPATPVAIRVFPYDKASSKTETPHICIGVRPDLNIPGILVDRKTGEIRGRYVLKLSKTPR